MKTTYYIITSIKDFGPTILGHYSLYSVNIYDNFNCLTTN